MEEQRQPAVVEFIDRLAAARVKAGEAERAWQAANERERPLLQAMGDAWGDVAEWALRALGANASLESVARACGFRVIDYRTADEFSRWLSGHLDKRIQRLARELAGRS